MGQDKKCFFGVHKYQIKEKHEVKDNESGTNATVGINYLCACENCGKIKITFVPTDDRYLNLIR